jgi:hypothetical protein
MTRFSSDTRCVPRRGLASIRFNGHDVRGPCALFGHRFRRLRQSGGACDPKHRYPRCVAGARQAPVEDSGGAESFMDRHIPETTAARKRRHAERKLRDVAKLLEDPALDDVAFRARSRAILGR